MMTIDIDVYASKLCHNSLKYLNSIWFSAALATGLALSAQSSAMGGNAGGVSMYIAPAPQETPGAGAKAATASASERAPSHIVDRRASSGLVDMVSEAARRNGV